MSSYKPIVIDESGNGLLFKNKNKKKDNHPDYTGVCNINGQQMEIAAWIKEGKAGKFMSLSIKDREMDQRRESSAPAVGSSAPMDESEIPF